MKIFNSKFLNNKEGCLVNMVAKTLKGKMSKLSYLDGRRTLKGVLKEAISGRTKKKK